ncbi:hypothetical protein ACJBU6_08987 [Exserohilum turcicum]
MLQAEIINSLKQAATSQVCVLDLRLLHEASVANRNETLVTLDELKQRLYFTRPMARQPRDLGEGSREWQSHVLAPTTKANRDSAYQLSDHYVSPVADYPPHSDYSATRHPSTDYPPLYGRDAPHLAPSAYGPAHPVDPNLAMALKGLPPNLPAAMMRDIQHVISSYRDLTLDGGAYPEQSRAYHAGYSERPEARDTSSYNHYSSDPTNTRFQKDAQHEHHHIPQAYSDQDAAHSSRSPAFKQDIFELHSEQYGGRPSLVAPNPYPQMQTRASTQNSQGSESSSASSAQSNFASPDRISPNPSHASSSRIAYAPPQHFPSSENGRIPSPLSKSYQADDDSYCDLPIPCSPHSSPEDREMPPPIPPLSPARNHRNASSGTFRQELSSTPSPTTHSSTKSPIHVPWPGTSQKQPPSTMQHAAPQRHPLTIEEEQALRDYYRLPKYSVSVTAGNASSSTPSTPSTPSHGREHARTYSGLSAITSAAASSLSSLSTLKPSRHLSITSSTASTESTTSIPIGILPGRRMRPIAPSTSHSGPAPAEAMMAGRPNKDNSYWGFCKGAWAVREDVRKGLAVRTQPCGYYTTRQLWGCKCCSFTGDLLKAPHPTKKSKQIDVVDDRIKLSQSGIRYRWIFLAKSHVKKKSMDATGEGSFGCILCCFQDRVSEVYCGVEALMNHIALVHVGEMSEQVRRKANCILGVVAGSDDDFDINVPIFGGMDDRSSR